MMALGEEVVECERRCPKCGEPLYLLPDRDWTLGDVRTVDIICANCLFTDTITTVVARKQE